MTDAPAYLPSLEYDGGGGALVGWLCNFQRYDATGGLAADPGASPSCSNGMGLVSDGSDGAFVIWTQGLDLVLLRLTGTGDPAAGWNSSGQIVGYTPSALLSMVVTGDGAGGVFVCWLTTSGQLYLQRVTGAGAIAAGWPALGEAVALEAFAKDLPRPVPDGSGGVFLAWTDARPGGSGDVNIYAQHLLGDGSVAPGWAGSGSPICTVPGSQKDVTETTDGLGGVYIAWSDSRISPPRIYAQHVLHDESIPLAAPGPSLQQMFSLYMPNPTRGGELYCAVTLMNSGGASLSVFDLAGRKVADRDLGATGSGTHWVRFEGRSLRAGVYVVRLNQGDRFASSKVVLTR